MRATPPSIIARLTRRANQVQSDIIDQIIKPAPVVGSGLLFVGSENLGSRFRRAQDATTHFLRI
jgi:hypothetical protein